MILWTYIYSDKKVHHFQAWEKLTTQYLSNCSWKLVTYLWHELGVTNPPPTADWKPNRKTGFLAYLGPVSKLADAPVPGCQTPIWSKGKQQNWSSSRKWPIEMKPAVVLLHMSWFIWGDYAALIHAVLNRNWPPSGWSLKLLKCHFDRFQQHICAYVAG